MNRHRPWCVTASGVHNRPAVVGCCGSRKLGERRGKRFERVNPSGETGRPKRLRVLPDVGADVNYTDVTEAAQDRPAVDRQRNTAVYVPVRPCEELLNKQLKTAAHSTHHIPTNDNGSDSWSLVVATHMRTAEAITALEAACSPAVATTQPRAVIIFVDESPSDREKTEYALSQLRVRPRFLHGDGRTYWSRSFHALLRDGLASGADYIVHLNTDVTLTAPIDVLLAPLRADPGVAAVAGELEGDVRITGYRPVHPWFPFFRSVKAGDDAALLPASCVAYRASALRSTSVDLRALNEYEHGWADIELSLQLRAAGYRLATTHDVTGQASHVRYFRRAHHFDRYGGSLIRYVRECPTAPCFGDTKRIGRRLLGPFWPLLLRVYVPVSWQWLRHRLQAARS
jgi:hypothetical protein